MNKKWIFLEKGREHHWETGESATMDRKMSSLALNSSLNWAMSSSLHFRNSNDVSR